MPQVRRVRVSPEDESEPRSAKKPERTAPVRRRQAAQAQLQHHHRRPPVQQDKDDKDGSAPLLLKVLSWLGLILLCFVLGYLGTSWIMDFLNKKLLLKPENRIENQEDLTEFQESESAKSLEEALSSNGNVKQISLNLYHVQDDTISGTRKNFVSGTKEDNIRDAVEEILTLSNVPNAGKIKLLHVFRSGNTAFLDMPGQFASSLDSMGQRKSLLLLTGLVRTLQENFSPVTQIRFLIDSKQPKAGGTVNLAVTWKLPKRS